jgi:phenylacetate-CoA ligase
MKKLLSSRQMNNLINTKPSNYWMNERERVCLELFHEASQRVPGYKDFLRKNKINPLLVKTWDDFQKVPPVSKSNYLRCYPLKELCWDGTLKKPLVFTATSGSTGEPVYFLRDSQLDLQYSLLLETFLSKEIEEPNGPILVIVCFGMGLWIGGLLTYKAFELVSQRNKLGISIITPGINKKEIFNALKNIAPQFKKIVIAGYPPFVKDVIDGAEDMSIDLKKYDMKFLFAAEAISEEFRDYLATKVKIRNIASDIMTIYGSADIGAMAFGTRGSILIRREARKNKDLFNDIFSPIEKTPTLAQFNPLLVNFEEVAGEILLTGNSAMPLVRYAIGDNGGVLSFDEAVNKLKSHGIDYKKKAKELNIADKTIQLPFVYVYERKDLSTTFYGLWIYPEWIRPAFLEEPLSTYFTGKFTLITRYDKQKNQYLEINIELRKDKKHTKQLEKLVLQKIIHNLRSHSSEFVEINNQLKKRSIPKLIFWQTESSPYFTPGVKQKWVQKIEAQ